MKGFDLKGFVSRAKAGLSRLLRQKLFLPAGALTLCVLTALSAPRPLRLHVIANSDSAADQAVKLQVRDAILSEMNGLGPASGTAQARSLVLENGAALSAAAQRTLRRSGLSYGAALLLGQSEFPDRSYGGRFYPAGRYEALRVVLGSGQGKNWWCVIYPPLCLGALENGEAPEEVRFRSFFAELFEKLFGKKTNNAISSVKGGSRT